ncbi:NADH:ubiquinone oxidoreductase subunit 5 (chain L)/Multisubunit Na+/H+ antiporter, MnhA subunit [Actinopolyspora mzabensis]|uniref:NADH:ubiquinone oxidoreductase subunit 5 (Chain L)/Multisubunit Na+/H+ antiporter, MnhA subunit n=1 Tax=Actinopolyspora mzabensis TaxID=995066 RepID=A0A1G9A6Y2_ACTMZ|nr:proton-conducting transporter membrane subunit [Actinopolyspora mzabensis]SDK22375.1 NADH:ubiquinone oxidoreductase subunit 5 (chain L)/Multisubunit Na+/H+ antiporter, MnhA subunit [Actinopolyspora mzabensis]
MSPLLWSLIAVPLGSGGLLACSGSRGDRYATAVGTAVMAVTLITGVSVVVARPEASFPFFAGMGLSLMVDGLSAILIVTVVAITSVVLLYAVSELGARESRARFTGLMLLFAGAMLTTVTASNLPTLLMGWEVMGAASWALIGFWWRDSERSVSANIAFLTTRAADLGLYLAAGAALAGGSGSLALGTLPDVSQGWLELVTAGIVVAALGKSAQLPFHFWLSRAMSGPSAVSALLHSATMVAAGGYLLLRSEALLAASGWGEPVVAWTGVFTAFVLGLVAVAQRDLKQLLAASTSAQLGFVVLAAGVGSLTGGTVQLVAHAATKSALFLVAGAWLIALGTKDLRELRGAARRYRGIGVAFTLAAASLAGIPPLSLWVAKDEVLAAALAQAPALYAVGTVAALLSTVYTVKAALLVWRPAPDRAEVTLDRERVGTRRVSPLAESASWVLAGGAALLGVLGIPSLAHSLDVFLGPEADPSPALWQLVVSTVATLLVAGSVRWWAEWRIPTPLLGYRGWQEWLGVEGAVRILLVRPVLVAARTLAAFDDRVLDRLVSAVPVAALWLARLVGRRVESWLDGSIGALTGGVGLLGSLARRPQTGQLHQYYVQAVVALALLAVLVVLG